MILDLHYEVWFIADLKYRPSWALSSLLREKQIQPWLVLTSIRAYADLTGTKKPLYR